MFRDASIAGVNKGRSNKGQRAERFHSGSVESEGNEEPNTHGNGVARTLDGAFKSNSTTSHSRGKGSWGGAVGLGSGVSDKPKIPEAGTQVVYSDLEAELVRKQKDPAEL